MGYVSVQDGSFEVGATSGLRLYAAIAFPLIAVTLVIYGLAEFFKQRTIRERTQNSIV